MPRNRSSAGKSWNVISPLSRESQRVNYPSGVDYKLRDALPILSRTPAVLRALLADLPDSWTTRNEGVGTWSPYDVVGHLIHGERTDWMPRVEHLLAHGDRVPFPPFDREAMFTAST